MIHYENETTEQRAERIRIGLRLTPYHLPESTEREKEMAYELLSRYVQEPHPRTYGGDCLAFGRMLGQIDQRNKPWWRRLFNL